MKLISDLNRGSSGLRGKIHLCFCGGAPYEGIVTSSYDRVRCKGGGSKYEWTL